MQGKSKFAISHSL